MTDKEKDKAINLARNMSGDFDAEEADKFAEKHADKNWIAKFRLLLQIITDKEFSLGASTWAIIAGALAYVVLPIDVIPDFIPGLGWIDDIFVLTMVTKQLSDVIDRYQEFRREQEDA